MQNICSRFAFHDSCPLVCNSEERRTTSAETNCWFSWLFPGGENTCQDELRKPELLNRQLSYEEPAHQFNNNFWSIFARYRQDWALPSSGPCLVFADQLRSVNLRATTAASKCSLLEVLWDLSASCGEQWSRHESTKIRAYFSYDQPL